MITSRSWRGKRYAVLGLARSGAATVEALLASGAEVVAWDSDAGRRDALNPLHFVERAAERSEAGRGPMWPQHSSPDAGASPSPQSGEGLSFADPLTLDLSGFTAVVVSPGVPLNRHPIAGHAAKYGVPVIGDIELFAQARAELSPHKVVGITGTNGKSTTTALVHHILQTAGVPTTMGGNIGLPILGQEPLPAEGVYVLELSSYQIDLTFTLDCDVAVLLNVTPDHLDRYESFEAYAASKVRLFEMQSVGKPSIVGDELIAHHSIVIDRSARDLWGCDNEYPFPNQYEWPALQGPHNGQNADAAMCVASHLGLSKSDIEKGLRTYPGLPHRMERIRERDGVLYVNDSKATNADSAAPALAAYPAVRWILGGQAKTAELDACVPHFGHVRSAYTIGASGPMFADLLRPHMKVDESGTLAAAVQHAARDAVAGETVLLSPACASFDQFRDFEDRGDQFRQLVEAL
ncbi:UDP-N-acetylmuramoyl-L-alanine--D-glutamate ligase [Sphingomonas sp. SUN039]|uniref:UDP-N-acetylmuramoyl-L-alanine--D-glutamate ligase n=1 Tax=Sphingomonas sp. SUN039 TaxID=2937787 RepID=UPI0021648AC9|nr:UDP-N-acetylmuramoyl-L-alanine--D-glutamate ligase [Sphingomonas sp. SUN039]UVO54473.1 UDP-N-acetylmuramoyl-L-alanine--D-glutamate ligase [Sphingomonas sp. SUN039]